MRWILGLVLVAGCATQGVDRHARAPVAQAPWALEAVYMTLPRGGQLSASREWERGGSDRVVTRSDDAVLRADFARDLARAMPLDAAAPRRLRVILTQQDPGYFEGLAAETSDVTLRAELLDADGHTVDTITLREPASAPLQRSASQLARLQPALDRL
ncbi:MAG TPA: hypothetical protein VGL86_01640, partial [Polyangia bacterium]